VVHFSSAQRSIPAIEQAGKKKRDGPKRPPSAYILFCGDKRRELVGRGSMTSQEVVKAVAEMWKAVTAEEKRPYDLLYVSAMADYDVVNAEYKKRKLDSN
jgi:HMG (high mobility group) box